MGAGRLGALSWSVAGLERCPGGADAAEYFHSEHGKTLCWVQDHWAQSHGVLLALSNISEELTLQRTFVRLCGEIHCWVQDDWARCHGVLLALSNVSEELTL